MKLDEILDKVQVFEKLYNITKKLYNLYSIMRENILTGTRLFAGELCYEKLGYEFWIKHSPSMVSITPLSSQYLIQYKDTLPEESIIMLDVMLKIREEVKDIIEKLLKFDNFKVGFYIKYIDLEYKQVVISYKPNESIRLYVNYLFVRDFPTAVKEDKILVKVKNKIYELRKLDELEIVLSENKVVIKKIGLKKDKYIETKVEQVEIVEGEITENIRKLLDYSEKIIPLLEEYYNRIKTPIMLIGLYP